MESPPKPELVRRPTLSRIASVRNLHNIAKVKGPTGRISIVFTDVQDSTKLWDADQDAMSIAVKSHHTCMRNGIRRHNGYEVKTEGDAFMVAFSTAKEALKFCLQMQEDLINIDYPMALLLHQAARQEKDKFGTIIWRGLRVRMGVHTGSPQCELDPVTGRTDYYGPMVNLSARVSGQAKGGQITISKDTFDEIRHDLRSLGLPSISDAGLVELKGISKSIRIYGLIPDKLSQRQFSSAVDPHAEINYLKGITNELNNELDNLDPDAARREALTPTRQRSLHVQPVMLDVNWLQKPDDVGNYQNLQQTLSHVEVSKQIELLASSTFATSTHDILTEAIQIMKPTILNLYKTLHGIVTSIPRADLYLIRTGYQTALSEIKSLTNCIDQADSTSQMISSEVDTPVERPLSASDVSDADTPIHSVVMIQMDNVKHLHETLPAAFSDATNVFQSVIRRLLKAYKGERVNYGCECIPPLGHDINTDDEDLSPAQRPRFCQDTEFLLLFNKDVDAVNFCLSLHTELLSESWPEELQTDETCKFTNGDTDSVENEDVTRSASYYNEEGDEVELPPVKKSYLWGGLKIRCASHTGPTSEPTISPAGVKWYTGTGIHRCANLLRCSYGGEILVSESMWSSVLKKGKRVIQPVAVFEPRSVNPSHVLIFSKDLQKRREQTDPGEFLDTRFWIPSAPVLPQCDDKGYLTYSYRMKQMTEVEVANSVKAVIKRRTDRQQRIFNRQQRMITAHENTLMAMHDRDAYSSPLLKSRETPINLPDTNQQHDQDVKDVVLHSILKMKSKAKAKRRARTMSPQREEHTEKGTVDLFRVHCDFSYFVELVKKYLNTPLSGGGIRDLTADDVQKLFTKRVFRNGPSDHTGLPFREQYASLVDHVLEDVSNMPPDPTSFCKVADSLNGLAAKLFLLIKNFRTKVTVAANKSRQTCEMLQKQTASPGLHWSTPGSGKGTRYQSPNRRPSVTPPVFDESEARTVSREDSDEKRGKSSRKMSTFSINRRMSVQGSIRKKRVKRIGSVTQNTTSSDVDASSTKSSVDLQRELSSSSVVSIAAPGNGVLSAPTESSFGKLKKRKTAPLASHLSEFGKKSVPLRRKSLTPIPQPIALNLQADEKGVSKGALSAPRVNKKNSLKEIPAPPTPPSGGSNECGNSGIDISDLHLESRSGDTPTPDGDYITSLAATILKERSHQSPPQQP